MAKVFIIVTSGPENPTKAVLPFLVVRNAREQGHEVSVFLAGDSTYLIKDEVVEAVVGVGPGALKDHFKATVEAKVPISL
ncbi:MAG: DsrE family protein [Candidatus Methylomirabilales bacterium]